MDGKNLSILESGIVKQPGDELTLKITKTNRKVATLKQQSGKKKQSITQYPNGTIHKTETIKP